MVAPLVGLSYDESKFNCTPRWRMRKFEIVNALAAKCGYRSYLEICTPSTGQAFHKVSEAQLRTRHRLMYRCPRDFNDGDEITFSSDDDRIEGLLPHGALYDIIFVDAWHTYACVQRDLELAFSLLSPGGTMVVHDCSPPSRDVAVPEFRHCPWCGVTYCAYIDFVWSRQQVDHYTVDTDYGCGLVKKLAGSGKEQTGSGPASEMVEQWRRERTSRGYEVFDFFDKHRRELLNLVSVDDFLAREGVAGPGAFLKLVRRVPGWTRLENRLF
jgi:hypothetical protein